ncbi:hypothetical protein [Microbacterium esteraromaticum]|uniref:hypothetical protein n=1 Tax=Microbacterium esteraromaticum TaxID=57043 RepID=UPI0019D3A7B5|nr:hypothetical protein [Microbacterium esteraromaticum]MBN7792506.1 hypothetical protein [Microbacterium esteraromaticum]
MRTALCNGIYRLTGHHVCCGRIPNWTAGVGQRWDTYDLASWNLYNIIWRVQAWVRAGMD